MKLNVEIDLGDEYFEEGEGGYVSDKLKESIIHGVVTAIVRQLSPNYKRELDEAGLAAAKAALGAYIMQTSAEIMSTGQIKGRSIEEHVRDCVANQISQLVTGGTMQSIAKKHADELKAQYDIKFANLIVQRLHENHLLKDEAAKILLSQ